MSIEIKDLSFSYGRHEVLRDIIAQTLHMERETKPKPVQTG